MNKRIAIICGRSFVIKKFRYDLINKIQDSGYDVSVVSYDNEYYNDITSWNVNYYCVNADNRSLNPIKRILLIKRIKKTLLRIKPDVVLCIQTSPVIFGAIAAKLSKISNIYSTIEGVGDVFIYNTLKWKIIRFIECILYKIAFKYTKKVIFENNDDLNEFIRRKLINKSKCILIPSVGIDTNKFEYKPIKNTNIFLMMSRLMPSKGIIEYCEAARIVKRKYSNVIFQLIGSEFTLKIKDIQEYIDDGSIDYLGYQENVIPFIENCYVHVLPSYREGFGLVILEAGSIGRASIVTNTVGCKDAVINNKTGLYVKLKDENDLADKIIFAIENQDLMIEMGKNARNNAVTNYDKEIINSKILEVLLESN